MHKYNFAVFFFNLCEIVKWGIGLRSYFLSLVSGSRKVKGIFRNQCCQGIQLRLSVVQGS